MKRFFALLAIATYASGPALAATPARSVPNTAVARWSAFIDEAALRFEMPRAWIVRVMTAESAGQTWLNGQPITSDKGAMGLMQLMPGTYAEMRQQYDLGPDPYDPHDNILAGTAYLRSMFDRFGYPGLFAAYNAGPTRYEASLRGVPLPAETRNYLVKVVDFTPALPPVPPIFVSISGDPVEPKRPQTSGLFVLRLTPDTAPQSAESSATPAEDPSAP